MRIRNWSAALLMLAVTVTSCSERGALNPQLDATPQMLVNASNDGVRISEIHYDNDGTDGGEAIEVSAPVGVDLTGWSLVLYNGSTGAAYDTDLLTGLEATVCGARKVVVRTYPSNGIQNGSPDGIALVDANGTLVEFLSYEGTITGISGPANGVTSTDIGVNETDDGPTTLSLQRTSNLNTWVGPTANTWNACNDNESNEPPAAVARIEISPDGGLIDVAGQIDFDAQAYDAEDAEIAAELAWSSSAPGVLHVDAATGVATGVSPGDAEVIATASNGVEDRVSVRVDGEAPPPAVDLRVVEVHYDDVGTDAGEAIEVRGPAGASIDGWSIVLYNGSNGLSYKAIQLSGVLPDQCAGEGTLAFDAVGIQNGAPDGIALVRPDGLVHEFLSYEGFMTAANGPAQGQTSTVNIGDEGAIADGNSLQLYNGVWSGPHPASFGACNTEPPPPPRDIRFFGRTAGDVPLPVGFEDQIFARQTVGGAEVETTFTWTSETPNIAAIDQDGVMRALAAGTAVIRATAADGTTATHTLPTQVATQGSASYGNHIEFGQPVDGNASDDFIVNYVEYQASFSEARGIPNWVSFNLEATHQGAQDRCDCFTYDPNLPADFDRYTTADYTGAGDFHGYGIDRGHLVRSFDRTAGTLDNANTFYFTNIIPQTADNNQGPWSDLEFELGSRVATGTVEAYIIAGASGGTATVKNEGKITIPDYVWKVAVLMPRDQGLDDVDSHDDVEVIAVIMPNVPGIRNEDWQTYQVTVDEVEALSGYDVLSLLPDHIETAVESNTVPPSASTDGPYTGLENIPVTMNGTGTDADGDALTFSWNFGDGHTATGSTVSHSYATGGSYTVQLVVTDTRGLADTTSTTATIATPVQALGDVYALIDALGLNNSQSLEAKINAAVQQLGKGNETPALGQLDAFLNELDALVRSGRLTEAQAATLRAAVQRVIDSIEG